MHEGYELKINTAQGNLTDEIFFGKHEQSGINEPEGAFKK